MAPSSVLSRALVLFYRDRTRVTTVTQLSALFGLPRVREVPVRQWSSAVGPGPTPPGGPGGPDPAPAPAVGGAEQSPAAVAYKVPESADTEVTVQYRNGLPELTVSLPSRKERCTFRLRPVSHVVGDLVSMLKNEDRGIETVAVTTMGGVRIGSANSIESLMEGNFKLRINDIEYVVQVPPIERLSQEQTQQISDVRLLVTRLYESLNVQEHQLLIERELLARLEVIRTELAPMEEIAQSVSRRADFYVRVKSYTVLFVMGMQFGILGRLTWWEYSWDIMEPITYFVTYGTAIYAYGKSLVQDKENGLKETRTRYYLISFYKLAKKRGLDVERYNELKDSEYQIEKHLAKLRDPLQVHLPARPYDLPFAPQRSALTRAQNQIRNLLNMRNNFFSNSSKPSSQT